MGNMESSSGSRERGSRVNRAVGVAMALATAATPFGMVDSSRVEGRGARNSADAIGGITSQPQAVRQTSRSTQAKPAYVIPLMAEKRESGDEEGGQRREIRSGRDKGIYGSLVIAGRTSSRVSRVSKIPGQKAKGKEKSVAGSLDIAGFDARRAELIEQLVARVDSEFAGDSDKEWERKEWSGYPTEAWVAGLVESELTGIVMELLADEFEAQYSPDEMEKARYVQECFEAIRGRFGEVVSVMAVEIIEGSLEGRENDESMPMDKVSDKPLSRSEKAELAEAQGIADEVELKNSQDVAWRTQDAQFAVEDKKAERSGKNVLGGRSVLGASSSFVPKDQQVAALDVEPDEDAMAAAFDRRWENGGDLDSDLIWERLDYEASLARTRLSLEHELGQEERREIDYGENGELALRANEKAQDLLYGYVDGVQVPEAEEKQAAAVVRLAQRQAAKIVAEAQARADVIEEEVRARVAPLLAEVSRFVSGAIVDDSIMETVIQVERARKEAGFRRIAALAEGLGGFPEVVAGSSTADPDHKDKGGNGDSSHDGGNGKSEAVVTEALPS